ncbi:MAG: 7-cyano-7-deazaguanine synthase QueC [Bdellovibrio sp.]|nr:7-cyano-7-deazaguanine synthase QueC [Bdellovibrio sp.]
MTDKSVVLLSAGLDSTVNFYEALSNTEVVLALTFDYGQKAAKKEVERAKLIADMNHVKHMVISLPWFQNLGSSSLTTTGGSVPQVTTDNLDNKEASKQSAKAVWIPNRNGVFLNIAASFAESLKANMVIPGFNAEEAETFPDNSFDFMRATRKAFTYSTANHVNVQCYTITKTKVDIVKMGKSLNVPFGNIWPCYLDLDRWCGKCESCQRAKRAFTAGGVNVDDCFYKG